MTHHIPEFYHNVSEILSNILDNVDYSNEDRDRKVRIATETELFINMSLAFRKSRSRRYVFGSRGEGSTGPGLQSDIDMLRTANFKTVITHLYDCQPDKNNYLMVKDNSTHPGYVKLQHIYVAPDNTPVPLYWYKSMDEFLTVDLFNRSVLSNAVYHFVSPDHLPNEPSPAVQIDTGNKLYSCDSVLALRCSQWPQEGYEWFQRRRLYGWPTPEQIENAWVYGCFVTCVGHTHSPERHLEWRLSFSIAERELVRSFEETVMKVYILLKMVKKTFIEPVLKDAFSSYHCKVCMLWMREKTPRELWSNENLLYCLILCIRQLYEWATAGFCPDYFIAKNNIYDRKIVDEKLFDLVLILRELLSADCMFLHGIQCCSLGKLLANRISGMAIHHVSDIVLIRGEVFVEYRNEVCWEYTCIIMAAFNSRRAIIQHIPFSYSTLVDYLQRIHFASNHMSDIMQYPLKHAMISMCSQLGFHIATVCKENACYLSHEQVDYLAALASGFLSFGINSDATSVRLKLCGLGMELGNYDLTEACLQHIGDNCMKYIYSVTVDSTPNIIILDCNIHLAIEGLNKKRFSTEELLQTMVSYTVIFTQSEISITPTPLRMEMFRSTGALPQLRLDYLHFWYDWGVVDSLICLYFFQYLNFSRQGKLRHKQVAMDNMINVIRTEKRLLHRDTALNLLGYSFTQENQLTNAFKCFTHSLKIRPDHNAAKFYLALLFKRVLTTQRRPVYGSRLVPR